VFFLLTKKTKKDQQAKKVKKPAKEQKTLKTCFQTEKVGKCLTYKGTN